MKEMIKNLQSWLLYLDRNSFPYFPINDETIMTTKFWHKVHNGDIDEPGWIAEEWMTSAALVHKAQAEKAAGGGSLPAHILSPHDLDFLACWDNGVFDFGEVSNFFDTELYAWIYSRKDPITQELIAEPRQDFMRYHGLSSGSKAAYKHPLDDIEVLRLGLDIHDSYSPTVEARVHRDYLRDYLSARKFSMVISQVADRFANMAKEEDLGMTNKELHEIDRFTWLETMVREVGHKGQKYFHGRSTIRRNLIILPLDRPRLERSVWYSYDTESSSDSEPLFIADADGTKLPLSQHHFPPIYYYFKPQVLGKYLNTPGYEIYFHMRNWGAASGPMAKGNIAVGINSQGLVQALPGDIADQRHEDQVYWASFSCLPSGEVCNEMFQTQMQCNPPDSPGAVELIADARKELNSVFESKWGAALFDSTSEEPESASQLSVGPLGSGHSEVFELGKLLYHWVIEKMSVAAIRSQMDKDSYDKKWGQIKLLEELLKKGDAKPNMAGEVVAPLKMLNRFRIANAHLVPPDLSKELNFGITEDPSPRDIWARCVDSTDSCLRKIADLLAEL